MFQITNKLKITCFISGPQVGLEDEADRKQKLLTNYGFLCKCSACTSDDWKFTEKMRHVRCFTGNTLENVSVFDNMHIFQAYTCPKCQGPSEMIDKFLESAKCLKCGFEFDLQPMVTF